MGSDRGVHRVGTLPAVLPGEVCQEGDAPDDKRNVEEAVHHPRQVLHMARVQLLYGVLPGDCRSTSVVVEGAGVDVRGGPFPALPRHVHDALP